MDSMKMVGKLRKLAAAQDSNYLRTMTNKSADELEARIAEKVSELRAAASEAGSQTTTCSTLRNLAEMYADGRLAL